MKTLIPGDRIYYIQNGRRLRGVVQDYLPMKARGEEMFVPVQRVKKIVFKTRSQLRKLPDKR